MAKVLGVDDELSIVVVQPELLSGAGHAVLTARTPHRAAKLVNTERPDLVLTDLEMPSDDCSGLEVLRQVKSSQPAVPVIILSGQGSKHRAIAAFREGARDFVEKPFSFDELLQQVENALGQRQGERALRENLALKQQIHEKFRFENILGSSPPMRALYRVMERIAARM